MSISSVILSRSQQQLIAASPALHTFMSQKTTFTSDVEVLNYALTLEHLEAAFYAMAGDYMFGNDAFGNPIGTWLSTIGEHENAHVTTLTDVITKLGGEPVAAGTYDFGVTDSVSYLATAATLENVGVMAYDGAGAAIADPTLLTAAGSIVAVEARHASYLNLITGANPFPAAFETPKTPDEILALAGPFIVKP